MQDYCYLFSACLLNPRDIQAADSGSEGGLTKQEQQPASQEGLRQS